MHDLRQPGARRFLHGNGDVQKQAAAAEAAADAGGGVDERRLTRPPAEPLGAFQLSVQTLGRLKDPEQFGEIVVRADADGHVRVRDIARVELGAQDYTINTYLDRDPATALLIYQRPGSNALATAAGVKAVMADVHKDFPAGLDYRIVYNPTEFIQESVDAVVITLLEAVALVVLVVILFLQTWRAAIIPIIAIPVSLVGTFVVQLALGFSINSLSLFALVAIGGIDRVSAASVLESGADSVAMISDLLSEPAEITGRLRSLLTI